MKAKRLAVVAMLVLLCACGGPGSRPLVPEREAAPAVNVPSDLEAGAAIEIVFAVSNDAGDILISAAEHFSRELYARTNGAIVARVEESMAPDVDLLEGIARMALLNDRRQFEFCPTLTVTATPFLYNGYNNFLMRANSRSTMNILEFSLGLHGLTPLAAFYQGTQHLLINFSPGGYRHFEGMTIIVSEGPEVAASFGRLTGTNGSVIVNESREDRLERFLQGYGNAVEITPDAFADMEENFEYQRHLIASYHNLTPVWLVADADFMDGLPPLWRAEITELISFMSGLINEAHRHEEEQLLRQARELSGITVVSEFSNVRNWVFNTLPPLEEEADEQQRLARTLLEQMRRTA